MQPKSPMDYSLLAIRVVLGLWFLVIGLQKIVWVGVQSFSRQVAEFRILMDPWNLPVAYVFVWMEVIAGVCLIAGWLQRGASRALVGLTLVFIFVNGQAMVLGFEPDCGCFGTLFKLGPAAKMVLLVAQLGLLAFVIVTEKFGTKKYFKSSKMSLPG